MSGCTDIRANRSPPSPPKLHLGVCVSSSRHLTLHTRAHTSFHLLYSCHFSVWFRPLCVFSLPFPFFLLVGTGGQYEHLQCCRWWCMVPACAPFIDLCFSTLLLYCRSSSSLIFFFVSSCAIALPPLPLIRYCARLALCITSLQFGQIVALSLLSRCRSFYTIYLLDPCLAPAASCNVKYNGCGQHCQ